MAVRRQVVPSDPNAAGDTGAARAAQPSKRRPGETQKHYQQRLEDEAAAASSFGGGSGKTTPYVPPGAKPIYIGVDAGSDLEKYGYQMGVVPLARPGAIGSFASSGVRPKPRYTTGYLNSDKFSDELAGMNKDAIQTYQTFMEQAGLLKKYAPGRLDKATKAAFKELLTSANQKGTTWQAELEETIAMGGVRDPEKEKERDPFQAVVEDPASLRQAFQKTARDIYGGDLPDAEVQGMVDAFRAQQIAKQQAAYNAEGLGGTLEKEVDPEAFVTEQLKATHPQQLNRVKFTDAFDSILDTFTGGGQ